MRWMNDKRLNLAESIATLEQAGLPWKVSETVTLTRRESLRLIDVIENPLPMNEKFIKLMADCSERARHLPDAPW